MFLTFFLSKFSKTWGFTVILNENHTKSMCFWNFPCKNLQSLEVLASFSTKIMQKTMCFWHFPYQTFQQFKVLGSFSYRSMHLGALGTNRFGPNPGQAPFGATFRYFEPCQLAIQICFWKTWETALLGQILARSLLTPEFGNLRPCN